MRTKAAGAAITTVVIGNFREPADFDKGKSCLAELRTASHIPVPDAPDTQVNICFKGTYEGMMFVKCPGSEERDKLISCIKEAAGKLGASPTPHAEVDQPINTRTVEGPLYSMKQSSSNEGTTVEVSTMTPPRKSFQLPRLRL